MDYETIVYGCNCKTTGKCYIGCQGLSWSYGEITEVELPILGGFSLSNGDVISISDFMRESSTKFVKMVLKDHYGVEVNVQKALADSPEIEYHDDGSISSYFIVDKKLSDQLRPGSYTLYVYIQNIVPPVNKKFTEKTIFNEMVTDLEGLEITIL